MQHDSHAADLREGHHAGNSEAPLSLFGVNERTTWWAGEACMVG